MSGEEMSRADFIALAGTSLLMSGYILTSAGGAAHARTPLKGSGEFPVGIWWPPPPEKTTAVRYAEIKEAGFNFVIGGNGVGNDRSTVAALDAAHANSLKFIVFDSSLYQRIRGDGQSTAGDRSTSSEKVRGDRNPASILSYLVEQEVGGGPPLESGPLRSVASVSEEQKQAIAERVTQLIELHGEHPAFEGLKLYDEPHAGLLESIGYARAFLANAAPEKSPYVNVGPSHSSAQALGTSLYSEYLQRYMSRVSPPFLSFDHYPLLGGKSVTWDYFLNWAMIRNYALQNGVPSWGFVQSIDFDGPAVGLAYHRRPNRAELLWQINVALAYGAKGLQYFTYWSPEPKTVNFGQALISRSGTRTQLYTDAKSVNSHLGRVGKVLLPLVSEAVQHAGEKTLPRGTAAFRSDAFVNSVSGSPAVLSRFRRPGASAKERYLLVVNRSFSATASTTLKVGARVSVVQDFDPAWQTFSKLRLKSSGGSRFLPLNLQPGAARLLRLYRR